MKDVSKIIKCKRKSELLDVLVGAERIKTFVCKLTGKPVKHEWYKRGEQEISVQYYPFEYFVVLRG